MPFPHKSIYSPSNPWMCWRTTYNDQLQWPSNGAQLPVPLNSLGNSQEDHSWRIVRAIGGLMWESNVCWWFWLACISGSLLQKQLDRLHSLSKVSLPFQTLLLHLMVQKWSEEFCDPRGGVSWFLEKDQPNCLAKISRILHEKQLPCIFSWHSSLNARRDEAKSAKRRKWVWTRSSLADHLVGNLRGI